MSHSASKDEKPSRKAIGWRSILRGGAALASAAALAGPLQKYMIRRAHAAAIPSPYGAIVPTADENTGLNLIQLPPGFKYWSFGWTGDPLSDGNKTPSLHDGMAVALESKNLNHWEDWDDRDDDHHDDDDDDHRRYSKKYAKFLSRKRRKDQRVLLIRNHEQAGGAAFAAGDIQYSPAAAGGNTNLIWNTRTKQIEKSWASLSGTWRNCAGGVTPWASWLSCEESSATQTTTDALGNVFKHGYVFDVPAFGITGYNSTPIPEMGRFAHEAVCVDPRNSIVYQTEDGPSAADSAGSGFFRYIPKRYGRLHRGGKLQMMKIKGEPQKNMQFLPASSTIFKVEWVDVPNPDPNVPTQASCFKQGFDAGGASFRRLEGCWFDTDEDKVYFLSTDGGPPSVGTTSNPKGEGQVFVYDPDRRTLQVIYHSENVADCENPDNLVVTPRGGLLLCEDNAGAPINDGERLLGLTLEGEIFTFAKNNLNFTAVGLGNYLRVESGVTYTSDFRQQEWTGDLSPGNSSEWE